MAVLGAFGAVGVIFGVFLIIYGKIKKKKYRGGLIALVSLVVFIVAIALTPNGEEKERVETEPTTNVNVSWQEKIKEVAANDGDAGDKFEEISLFALDYKPTEQELKEFSDYIINEYKAGKYISDISNHEYMLENIFKSQVVEQSYEEGEPMKDFAFDFWQNVKYNYRGVENTTSGSTLANERQMDKALEQMGK